LDREVIERLPGAARVLMVASGGCTAALLASSPKVVRLHLVDTNPAQLALTRLKLHLLSHEAPPERLALLGHAPVAARERQRRGTSLLRSLGLRGDSLGPVDLWAEVGPDHAGRYERLFAHLRRDLHDHAADLESLLLLRDPDEQARRVRPNTDLGRALD